MDNLSKSFLTNIDIVQICKTLGIKLNSVLSNDELNESMLKYNFAVILNLENENQSGSHWTGLVNDASQKRMYYCDSYGMPPTERIYNMFLKHNYEMFLNTKQFQSNSSELCGWYAMVFIVYLQKGKYKINQMDSFIKLWNLKDLNLNDKTVKQIFSKLFQQKK